MTERVDWDKKIIYVDAGLYHPKELKEKVMAIYDKAEPSLDDTLSPIQLDYETIVIGWHMNDGWKVEVDLKR